MTTATATTVIETAAGRPVRTRGELRRAKALGGLYILLALASAVLFGRGSDGDATFRLTSPGDRFHDSFPDLTFNAAAAAYLIAVLLAIAGGVQLSRAWGRWQSAVMAVAFVLFIGSFLGWAAAGSSFSLVGMLQATVLRAVPITLGALAGVMCERVAVVNIAIEGQLLTGAFVGAIVGSQTSPWLGIVAAVASGALLSLLLAVLTIRYLVDQIIVGVVINIFALGLTSFVTARVLASNPDFNNTSILGPWEIPLLSDIPFLGPIFFEQSFFVYAAFVLVGYLTWLLFRTRWGLRARAVGEHPRAADTVGINVYRTRYLNVMFGGMIAGLGGAFFTIGSTGRFDENMTNGRGYIALAAMIFGRWHPMGALGAALVFGFADSLQQKLGILNTGIPSEFLLMAPFLVTIVVVSGLAGKTRAPAADGEAYVKE